MILNLISVTKANKINIDEINARQEAVLNELDTLDHQICQIIELWTRNDNAEHSFEPTAVEFTDDAQTIEVAQQDSIEEESSVSDAA